MQRGSRARSLGLALQMSGTSADTTCRDARTKSQARAGILRESQSQSDEPIANQCGSTDAFRPPPPNFEEPQHEKIINVTRTRSRNPAVNICIKDLLHSKPTFSVAARVKSRIWTEKVSSGSTGESPERWPPSHLRR